MKIETSGCTRTVFLIGGYAIKFPQLLLGYGRDWWPMFLQGLLGNMQERRFSSMGLAELAPVVLAVPGGFLLVMRRARPLTRKEWEHFDYQSFVAQDDLCIPVENKMNSFGVIEGKIVAIDYGS